MKKMIFALLLSLASSMVISSCTEDDVQPTADSDCGPECGNGGGAGSGDKWPK